MQKHLYFYECSKTGKAFNQMADENSWPIVILSFHRTETYEIQGRKVNPNIPLGEKQIIPELLVFECISLFAAHEIQKKFGFFREDNPRRDTAKIEYRERTKPEILAGLTRVKLSKGMGNPYQNPKIVV